MQHKNFILLVIVLAQFLCTSVWFAGNAVMADITKRYLHNPAILAHSSSVVQLGFVLGTLFFTLLKIAEKYSTTLIFFISALICAALNAGLLLPNISITFILFIRLFTGFFLAGIYPIGIKIAADSFKTGLGSSLGYLVGALVIGTALPHFLKVVGVHFPWQFVIIATSVFSVIGGFLIKIGIVTPTSVYEKAVLPVNPFAIGFSNSRFKNAAIGYFGHMWELYAFWAFVPVMITLYQSQHHLQNQNTSLLSFLVIITGSIACFMGGYLSARLGAKKIAYFSLFISLLCGCIFPIIFSQASFAVFYSYLLVWGFFIIPDSPQFSALVAQTAPENTRGSAITLITCIGFFITSLIIELISLLLKVFDPKYVFLVLAIGPFIAVVNNGIYNKK
jgi:MFS family permease